MAESVVRKVFPEIARSFLNWGSAEAIVGGSKECIASALLCFRHEGKIQAIAESAYIVHERTFETILDDILEDPFRTLLSFPYVGPTTVFHIAKNIGIPVAKPDRHLLRLASANGFCDVQAFCGQISDFLGEDIRKVDSVLWRFATLHHDYVERFISYST
jgi:hypothetical protein